VANLSPLIFFLNSRPSLNGPQSQILWNVLARNQIPFALLRSSAVAYSAAWGSIFIFDNPKVNMPAANY
jgi:hypothetical protein